MSPDRDGIVRAALSVVNRTRLPAVARSTRVRAAVPLAFASGLLAYTAVALAKGWWPSACLAPILAWLLWRRHRRARFAAYIFFSVMTARAVLSGSWALGLFALAAIALLQLPAARRAWPRLTPGRPLR